VTVASDLVTALGLSGLNVPVTAPGSTIGALPAVAVVPSDGEVAAGGRMLLHRYAVTVMVPRDGNVAQLDRLETLTDDVFAALVDAGYQVSPRVRYVGDEAETVRYVGRVLEVTDAGRVVC
jgi:hypothetical protein